MPGFIDKVVNGRVDICDYHFFTKNFEKIERILGSWIEAINFHYLEIEMASLEFNNWLLGLGGYIGLFSACVLAYLYYETVTKYYLAALILAPFASAAAFYIFFNILYIVLNFILLVTMAMLNEQITLVIISFTFLVGQLALILYVVYHNAYINDHVIDNFDSEVNVDDIAKTYDISGATDICEKEADIEDMCDGDCADCECKKEETDIIAPSD